MLSANPPARVANDIGSDAPPKGRGLAPRVILYILLFSSVVTFFATALQLYFDYSRDVRAIDERIAQISDSYLKSMVLGLWIMDYEQLRTQMEGILALPDIQYLAIEVDGEPLITAGTFSAQTQMRESYPLRYTYRGQDIHLGTLYIVTSLDGVYRRLFDRVLVIFGSQAVKTFLVSAFIFLIFQFFVTRHLQQISRYLRCRQSGLSSLPLSLSRKPNPAGREDELDDVVQAFGEMCGHLELSYKKLAESEERLNLAMRGANDGLWDWNLDTGNIFYSPRWKQMLGYEADEIDDTLSTWWTRVHPDDFAHMKRNLNRCLKGQLQQFECVFRLKHKDNSYRWVLSRGQALRAPDDVPSRIVGTHVDITAQKEAEEALVEATARCRLEQEQRIKAERLACIGELAASIAHEIRNPLASIINSQTLLTKGDLEDYERKEVIDILNEETVRLQRILTDFLSFARLPQPTIASHDIVAVLDSAVISLRLSLPGNDKVRLTTHYHAKSTVAMFDKDLIKQVILNLGLNAIQAMPNGGDLSISTLIAMNCVMIYVTDTGCGMSDELCAKSCNPFFTTRKDGTGLGLVVVNKILAQHNTDLNIRSTLGQGTTVRFSLQIA